ncbi:MAG: hypothetical protein AAF840_01500, partial [Bacteroidota bacterium]
MKNDLFSTLLFNVKARTCGLAQMKGRRVEGLKGRKVARAKLSYLPRFGLLPLLLFTLTSLLPAQKAITVADMQDWNTLTDEQISPDGRYVLYNLRKDVGDPTVVLYDTQTKQEHRFPRLHRASLSYDGKSMIGMLKPSHATVKDLRLKEKRKAKDKLADMDSLLVWHLANPAPMIIPQVYDFKMSPRAGNRYA